ncbi:MAG: Gfo/Idh/MocA family oxidoreductase [Chloroflexi bacterium]|nr:Gfo/Idh/MocA family oxidoreductase [Chloroflexota bacterium]
MTQRYRVAFAGVHRMLERTLASHNWAAAFAADPRTEMVAVFDKGAETRQAFVDCWGQIPTFGDYSEMLERVRPDVVCIATRQTMHAEQIEQAAGAGVKGVLCDKPLATSMAEVDRVVRACGRYGMRFALGVDRRWFPYYQTLVGLLREGAIGQVKTLTAFGLSNLVFHGCHWYDRVVELAGDCDVAWVTGRVDPLDGEPAGSRRHQDPPGSCHIHFVNGVDAFVAMSASPAGLDFSLDVSGSRGRLIIVRDGAETYLWGTGEDGRTPIPLPLPAFANTPPWPAAIADLFDAIAQGRPTRSDAHAARRATEIGFAVHHSHREGGRRIAPEEIDRTLRIESFPWGNE